MLLSFAASLLWVTLWTTGLRWLAVLPLILGVTFATKPERPEILIERDGSGIAVRGADGRLVIAGRPSRFVTQQWLASDGDSRPPDDATLRAGITCDSRACIVRTADGRSISYARDRIAVIEDCRRADLVVTNVPWSAPCAAKLVDRMALSRDGATSLYRSASGWRSHSSETGAGDRPWSRHKPTPPARPAPVQTQVSPVSAADADPDLL